MPRLTFLPMNGKRINSLEDLRENFNAKQMLAFYKAKRLHGWLEDKGYTEELENINSFEDGYDDDTLLSMLMAVFDLNDEQIANATPIVTENTEGPNPENESVMKNTDSAPKPSSQMAKENQAVIQEVIEENIKSKTQKSAVQQIISHQENIKNSSSTTTWQLGTITQKCITGDVTATITVIDDKELEQNKILADAQDGKVKINSPFFYNGYFWAYTTDAEGDYAAIKSIDLKNWTRDENLSRIGFSWGRVVYGDKHCILISEYSFDGGECVVCSPDMKWKKIDLDFSGEIRDDAYSSGILDLFEKDDCIGIFYNSRYQTGFIKKEDHDDNGLLICKNAFDFSQNEFEECNVYDDLQHGFIFKDKCFYFNNGDDFEVADISNWDFEPVNCNFEPSFSSKYFVFDDIAFIEECGLFFTKDGIKWGKCNFSDTSYLRKICELNHIYFAFCADSDFNSLEIFKSVDGQNWELWKNIKTDPHIDVAAGNDKMLLTNESNRYLFLSAEGNDTEETADTTDYLEQTKIISEQVKELVARELGIAASVITDDTDLITDLHAEEWRLKLLGYQLGEMLNVKFPNGEIPTKVIDIIISAVKSKERE